MQGGEEKLKVILKNQAIKCEATRDLGNRKAGEQWHILGPKTYLPEVGVRVVQDVKCYMIKKDCGLILRATLPGLSCDGKSRHPGEEWMVTTQGVYIPSQMEEVVREVKPIVLTEKRALRLQAKRTFTDIF